MLVVKNIPTMQYSSVAMICMCSLHLITLVVLPNCSIQSSVAFTASTAPFGGMIMPTTVNYVDDSEIPG